MCLYSQKVSPTLSQAESFKEYRIQGAPICLGLAVLTRVGHRDPSRVCGGIFSVSSLADVYDYRVTGPRPRDVRSIDWREGVTVAMFSGYFTYHQLNIQRFYMALTLH
jgi:hypothetical protein